MSDSGVAAMREAYERFGRGDFGPFEALDDDVEFVTAPEMPDAGTYRGEAARSFLTSWVGSFDALTMEASEFTDAGDRVLVAFEQVGTPREGSTPVRLPCWGVYAFRDDLTLARIQLFVDEGAARAAAGLAGP